MRRLAMAVCLLVFAAISAWRLNLISPAAPGPAVPAAPLRGSLPAVAAASIPVAVGMGGGMASPSAGVPPPDALRNLTYANGWSGSQPPALALFRDWVARYGQAPNAAARAALEPEGMALAR